MNDDGSLGWVIGKCVGDGVGRGYDDEIEN